MEKWTEIVCILDRSGSMSGFESDTIGGFNAFVGRQRGEAGRARLSLVLFDDEYEMPWKNVDIEHVAKLDNTLYYARGNTALLDAIGKTVSTMRAQIAAAHPDERPDHVVVLVVTDGYENSSQEFGLWHVRALIEETQVEGWQYVFLGADIDAIQTSTRLSMRPGTSGGFVKSSPGLRQAFSRLNRAVSDVRRTGRARDVEDDLDDDDWV